MNWHETAWTTARLRVRTGWAAALCLFFWLFVAGALPGYAQTYVEVHRRDPFLIQSLLQAEAGDFLGDGRTGLALSGRNYETNEVYVYVLYWNGAEFAVTWRSPNLWEQASHVAIAAGDFTGAGVAQIAVLTDERLRLFQWDGTDIVQVHEQPGVGAPAEIGVVRHPQHPYDLIAVSRRHGVDTDFTPLKGLELLGWLGGRFRPLWETETIGRVRALTAGDLTGNGSSELVVDVGNGMGPGAVQVWTWQDGAYRRIEDTPFRPVPAFGLTTADDGKLLIAADDRGRVAVYQLNGGLRLLGETPSLGWAVASAAAGDFFGDGGVQAVVIGYPSRLHVVTIVEGS